MIKQEKRWTTPKKQRSKKERAKILACTHIYGLIDGKRVAEEKSERLPLYSMTSRGRHESTIRCTVEY